VLERRSKGRFDGFCAALLDRDRELVRSMLLEGRLAQQGLLDRAAIATALNEPFPTAETVSRLLVLADVEAWADSWIARPVQRR
jgi:asparagine synthase (glutamine-hydrolysing)